MCPHPGSHKTNVLTKFHENWAKNVSSRVFTCFHYIHIEKTTPLPGDHVFFTDMSHFRTLFTRKTAPPTVGHDCQQTGTTFELHQHIIKTKIIASFDKTSTLFTSFKLDRGIIGTILLTKFHEDHTRNVASIV
ncbi:hypothetical protein DPMN_172835 [Dreissena polymorpha]|uniref:Uncharacterized protein n=1 Tax=Dreissena polymorpha TaxID=45954 RepID=A0A9D4IGZ6_DREPO|nr:hypothetical protein DPMN_172835 [Dreissena polymorpha]